MHSENLILETVSASKLTEGLRAEQIVVLMSLMTLRHCEVNDYPFQLDGAELQDALMMLVKGEIEISANIDHEPVSLRLDAPGDLARIVSFVGGNVDITANITVKRHSSVLLLKRTAVENLLNTHPLIAYCVMRNLVRHMHSVLRRGNSEKEALRNYLYHTHGRY